MTDNALVEILQRIIYMAEKNGTVYLRVTFDKDREMFNFTPLLKEFVKVHYGEKESD